MKKTGFTISILLLLFVAINSTGQNFLESGIEAKKNYLLLARPTVQNIETINFLLKNNIFQLPDVEFVGVYSEAENYDYNKSAEYILNYDLTKFHLQKVDGELNMNQIFQKNDWSEIFYKLFRNSAGILFFGGPDIQPEIYGQENTHSVVTDPNRHLFELSFLFHLLGGKQNESFMPYIAEKPNYFISGFCLGMQSMNVATGGTMTQDIPALTYSCKTATEIVKLKKDKLHRNYWQEISTDSLLMGINFHPIQYTANSFFPKRVKAKKIDSPLVLSSHHQSILDLGKNFIVTALSNDRMVIEGIKHRIYPNVFAVQFHPEVPALYTQGVKLKFSPDDIPKSYNEIISGKSLDFHLKYWSTISKSIKSSIKAKKHFY